MTSPSAPANPEAPPVAERSIGAILRELVPFLRPYLGRILLALACLVELMQGLSLDGPIAEPLLWAVVWSAGIFAVCSVPLAIGYRKASKRG